MNNRISTEYIAIHASDTYSRMDIGEEEIRGWHLDRGWSDIGYNIVIRRSGVAEIGRPLDYSGAHVAGYNSRSLGLCLVGGKADHGGPENNFTDLQFDALKITLRFLNLYAPGAKIMGHNEFPGVTKDCPCFDVQEWLEKYYEPIT